MSLEVLEAPTDPLAFALFVEDLTKGDKQQVIIGFTNIGDITRIERIFDVNNKKGTLKISKFHDESPQNEFIQHKVTRAIDANRKHAQRQLKAQAEALAAKPVNDKPELNSTAYAFTSAARHGNTMLIQQHIDNGDNPNDPDAFGWTPLMAAARNGHTYIVQRLLNTGKANPNTQGCSGWTPLMVAAKYGHEYIVQLLLEASANPYLHSEGLHTAYEYALEQQHQPIVDLIDLYSRLS